MKWQEILKLRNRDIYTGKRTDPTFQRKKFKRQLEIPKDTRTTIIEERRNYVPRFSKYEIENYKRRWEIETEPAKPNSNARKQLEEEKRKSKIIGVKHKVNQIESYIKDAERFLKEHPTPESYLKYMEEWNKTTKQMYDERPEYEKVKRTKRVDIGNFPSQDKKEE